MMLEDFLSPVGNSIIESIQASNSQVIGQSIAIHREIEGIPDLEGMQIAIIGVLEDRGSDNPGSAHSPDQVRKYLYSLYWGNWSFSACDLGNIYAGEKVSDTLVAVREICSILLKKRIIPLIIGGSQDICYGNFRAYDELEQTVNLVSIDAQFDLGKQNEKLNHRAFLATSFYKNLTFFTILATSVTKPILLIRRKLI